MFLLQQIIKASSKDAIRLVDSVSPTALDNFKQSTKKLTEEKAETEALAAALAHISGAASVDQVLHDQLSCRLCDHDLAVLN